MYYLTLCQIYKKYVYLLVYYLNKIELFIFIALFWTIKKYFFWKKKAWQIYKSGRK